MARFIIVFDHFNALALGEWSFNFTHHIFFFYSAWWLKYSPLSGLIIIATFCCYCCCCFIIWGPFFFLSLSQKQISCLLFIVLLSWADVSTFICIVCIFLFSWICSIEWWLITILIHLRISGIARNIAWFMEEFVGVFSFVWLSFFLFL